MDSTSRVPHGKPVVRAVTPLQRVSCARALWRAEMEAPWGGVATIFSTPLEAGINRVNLLARYVLK